jgi:hypothetical protein
MACTDQEWTIETKTDSATPKQATLVFCLKNVTGIITGEVFEGVGGPRLSSVVGKNEPILGSVFTIMTLTFAWSAVKIMMNGFTFKTGETIHFQGRFVAFKSVDVPEASRSGTTTADSEPLTAPDDGDTGTATGQQT